MSVANLSNQIRLMARAVGRPLSTDPEIEPNLVNQIATFLDAGGTQSILDLAYYSNQAQNLSFFYDIRTGHVFEQGIFNSATYEAGANGGGLFAVFGNKRENDYVYVFYTKDGFPVFWNVPHDNGSDWVDIRGGIVFVGSIVLAAVGLPLASSIGSAVLGTEVAASYPALAQGIGQAVINTLMNGGDIEKGATSAVASYVGAGVGGQVASATTSDVLGQATAAATRAYINGGDIDKAVAQSFLQSGVTNVQTLIGSVGSVGDVDYDPADFDADFQSTDTGIPTMSNGSYYTDENGITYGVDSDGDLTVLDGVDSSGIGYYTDADGDIQVADHPTVDQLSQTDSNGTSVYTGSASSGPGANVLTSLATAALALVTSYAKAGAPAIRTGNASSTVNANGTVTTRNANGSVTVTRPQVGTPYLTANGALVTNNGDGTFSTVSPNGQISTQPYSTSSNLTGSTNQLLIGGVILAALVLLRR